MRRLTAVAAGTAAARVGAGVMVSARRKLPVRCVPSRPVGRRLAAEHTTFGKLIDGVRRETAEHYLRDTDMSLSHLTRELGYAEQSVLSRSCQRWFGCGPSDYRMAVRSGVPGQSR